MSEKLEQRSPEWYKFRLGRITASRVKDLMTRVKYGESKYKENYRLELAIERLTKQQAVVVPLNDAMRDGIEREPEARDYFSTRLNLDVKEVGAYQHPTIRNAGASPDGIVSDGNQEFTLEIKCPTPLVHARNLLAKELPNQYKHQVHFQMCCAGVNGAYWVSYNPEFPKQTKMKYLFVERDDKLVKEMDEAIAQFDIEVDQLVKLLKEGAKNG
jgi:putative phage-type endonuclease